MIMTDTLNRMDDAARLAAENQLLADSARMAVLERLVGVVDLSRIYEAKAGLEVASLKLDKDIAIIDSLAGLRGKIQASAPPMLLILPEAGIEFSTLEAELKSAIHPKTVFIVQR